LYVAARPAPQRPPWCTGNKSIAAKKWYRRSRFTALVISGPTGDVAHAKIIDFGIARVAKSTTIIGSGFAGKYNYVSPEQLGLFEGNVTAKSDIYSLGIVLAECALGRSIDMGGSHVDMIEKRRVVPDLAAVDPRLRPLLLDMLQPDPNPDYA
jgi:serine/threonine protein kinase